MIFNLRERTTPGGNFDAIHKAPDKYLRDPIGAAYFTNDKLSAGPVRSIVWADEETRMFKVYGSIHFKHLDDVRRRGGRQGVYADTAERDEHTAIQMFSRKTSLAEANAVINWDLASSVVVSVGARYAESLLTFICCPA